MIRAAVVTCLTLAATSPAFAATSTWSGASSVTWATTGNWTNSTVPGTGDTAVFSGTATTNDLLINIGTGVTVNTILFTGGTGVAHSITAGSGSITLDDGGTISYTARSGGSSALQTISRPIVLSGSATFTNNNNTGAANGDILLLSGTITGSGPITITGTAAGASFVRIQANNTSTFTGSWDVRSGNLSVRDNGALGTPSSVTLNGGVLRLESGITVSRPITYASSTSSISFLSASSNLSGDLTLNSGVAATFSTGGGNGGTISGRILGDSTNNITVNHGLFSTAFTFSGAGSNTASGTTTIATPGVYALAKTGGATAVAGNLTVNPNTTGTALVRWDGSNQVADASIVTLAPSASTRSAWLRLNGQSDTIGGLASTGSGTSVVENEKNASTGTLTFSVASGTSYTFGGIIRNGTSATSGTLAIGMAGSGTQVLSGSNSYSGGATIQGGVLKLGHASALGTGTATLAAGTLDLGGFSTVANAIVLSGGTLASGTFAVSQLTATSGAVTARLTGAGGLSKSGAGTLILSGSNDYSGITTISGGTLALGSDGSVANSSRIIVGDTGSSGAVLDLTQKSSFTIGAAQTLQGQGTALLGGATALTVAGTFSPGNSPGLFTYDGGSTTLAGTTLLEIWGTGRGVNPGYDAVNVVNGGLLTLGGLLNLDFDQNFADNSSFLLIDASAGTLAGAYTSFTVTGAGSDYAGLVFQSVGGNVWETNATGNNQILRLTETDSSLTLQIMAAVPEPGALALACIGLTAAGLSVARRRCRV